MESASSPQTALGLLDFWRSLLSVLLSIEVRIEEILLPCRFRAMGLHTISEFQLRRTTTSHPPALHRSQTKRERTPSGGLRRLSRQFEYKRNNAISLFFTELNIYTYLS